MSNLLPVLQENDIAVEQPKKHVSYSELVTWLDCSWKHFQKYIQKIKLDSQSEHTEFGHVMHEALQTFLGTRVMPSSETVIENLKEAFAKYNISVKEKEFHDTVEPILAEVPQFLTETFGDWEYIAAEEQLYEAVMVQEDRFFKGFIDGIVKIKKSARLKRAKPDEYEYWIVDWKTCAWGWTMEKKTDRKKTMQLAFYKHFWSKKLGIPFEDIKCGFILLKRTPAKDKETGKTKSRIELVPVSVGPKTMQAALDDLGRMLGSVKKGFKTKNRNSCTYCEYKNTEHCR